MIGFFAALAATIPALSHVQLGMGGPVPPGQSGSASRHSRKPTKRRRRRRVKLARAGRLPKHQPHSQPQVHVITHAGDGKRVHLWSKGDPQVAETLVNQFRAGDFHSDLTILEHINGFGQVTSRETFIS